MIFVNVVLQITVYMGAKTNASRWLHVELNSMFAFEFSLNVFTELKIICQTCHLLCKRVFKLNQFMLQWFIGFAEFSEFLFHLRKTPLNSDKDDRKNSLSLSRCKWTLIAMQILPASTSFTTISKPVPVTLPSDRNWTFAHVPAPELQGTMATGKFAG